MRTSAEGHKSRRSLARAAAFRAAGVSIFGTIVWLPLFSADGSPWNAVSLIAVQALGALVALAWYLPRARAEKRWQAALDHYAEQEQATRKALSQAGSGAALPR
jgi:hypothetical protein